MFALGIMPYITSSIIMQLLGVVIPKLEQWQNEGQTGQKKITQWTRYLTVALALMQSTALVFVMKSGKNFSGYWRAPYVLAPRVIEALTPYVLTYASTWLCWVKTARARLRCFASSPRQRGQAQGSS